MLHDDEVERKYTEFIWWWWWWWTKLCSILDIQELLCIMLYHPVIIFLESSTLTFSPQGETDLEFCLSTTRYACWSMKETWKAGGDVGPGVSNKNKKGVKSKEGGCKFFSLKLEMLVYKRINVTQTLLLSSISNQNHSCKARIPGAQQLIHFLLDNFFSADFSVLGAGIKNIVVTVSNTYYPVVQCGYVVTAIWKQKMPAV